MYMDGVLPSGTHRRCILELDECKMDYSVVKKMQTKQKVFVHKDRESLQLPILYEMLNMSNTT